MADIETLTGEPTHDFKCVYAIVNQVNGKMYIGITDAARKRYFRCKSSIKAKKFNTKMNLDILAGHTFKMDILLEFPKNENRKNMLDMCEMFIEKYDSRINGYNRRGDRISDAKKSAAYTKRHNIKNVMIGIKDSAPINKAVLQAAADALELPLSQFMMQAATKHILDQLGAEWLEKQQNNGKE